MFRKLFSCLLLVVLLAVGISFHLEASEKAYATSIEIRGEFGGNQKKSFDSDESKTLESDAKLAKPKEDKIFLQKYPTTGEIKNYFFLLGMILISVAYLFKKRSRE